MPRTRLAILIASIGIVGAAALVGSAPASAGTQTTVTVSPNPVAPGAPMSYTISATCQGTFAVRIVDSGNPTGLPFLQTDPSKSPGTSAVFPAPTTPGTYSIDITGFLQSACADVTALNSFVVQAPATTAPPTTAPPTTIAPTTTAAAAVPPAPTTAAPTTAAPTTTAAAPAALPATGQELNLAVVALLLCLGGGGLVVATRRR